MRQHAAAERAAEPAGRAAAARGAAAAAVVAAAAAAPVVPRRLRVWLRGHRRLPVPRVVRGHLLLAGWRRQHQVHALRHQHHHGVRLELQHGHKPARQPRRLCAGEAVAAAAAGRAGDGELRRLLPHDERLHAPLLAREHREQHALPDEHAGGAGPRDAGVVLRRVRGRPRLPRVQHQALDKGVLLLDAQ